MREVIRLSGMVIGPQHELCRFFTEMGMQFAWPSIRACDLRNPPAKQETARRTAAPAEVPGTSCAPDRPRKRTTKPRGKARKRVRK